MEALEPAESEKAAVSGESPRAAEVEEICSCAGGDASFSTGCVTTGSDTGDPSYGLSFGVFRRELRFCNPEIGDPYNSRRRTPRCSTV